MQLAALWNWALFVGQLWRRYRERNAKIRVLCRLVKLQLPFKVREPKEKTFSLFIIIIMVTLVSETSSHSFYSVHPVSLLP